MSDPRFTSRDIRAGSAAYIAEQEVKYSEPAGVKISRVKAGSSARDAEDRRRALGASKSGKVQFSLRAQDAQVDRLPRTFVPRTEVSTASPPIEPTSLVDESLLQGAGNRTPSPHRNPMTISSESSPGLLQQTAAQLQSRIRAFFRAGGSS